MSNSSGYYRVNYDTRNWRLLATHLLNSSSQNMFSPTTRAQLIDDALNLARAGTLGYDVALNMTRYLADRESHYVPWKATFENMRFLNTMLRQTPAYGLFQVLVVQPLS
jgi:aminopeptidase N